MAIFWPEPRRDEDDPDHFEGNLGANIAGGRFEIGSEADVEARGGNTDEIDRPRD